MRVTFTLLFYQYFLGVVHMRCLFLHVGGVYWLRSAMREPVRDAGYEPSADYLSEEPIFSYYIDI